MKDNPEYLKEARAAHLQNIRSANNVFIFILAALIAVYRDYDNLPPYWEVFNTIGVIVLGICLVYIRKERKKAKLLLLKLKYP